MHYLHLSGSHYMMGIQHARQVQTCQQEFALALSMRERELAAIVDDTAGPLTAAMDALAKHPIWAMQRGIADGLGIDWLRFQRYMLSSYLLDLEAPRSCTSMTWTTSGQEESLSQERNTAEGCSVFAAAAPITRDGRPLLAKNRDYKLEHATLQTLTFSTPEHGYRYLHLGSVGSAGVFSSGMNERGLAIADTHVVSLDLGPGLPRYALMMDVLEQCTSTRDALAYLRSVRHMGGGILLLADAQGHLAVCESGHQQAGFCDSQGGWMAVTNHFVSPELAPRWLNTEAAAIRGHSVARRCFLEQTLAQAAGEVDEVWAQQCLGYHEEGLGALCRHERTDIGSATISGIVYAPTERRMWLAGGYPCEVAWVSWAVGAEAR